MGYESNIQKLEKIKEKAQTLLDKAHTGGDEQYVFELMVDPAELDAADNLLDKLGYRIATELAEQTA